MSELVLLAVNAACLPLVAAIGFAAQRANLCTVRAVEEVLTTRSARMLASFGKAALWASAVYGGTMLAMLGAGAGFDVHGAPGFALAGGFVFGVGAAITGGCAMSVLQRLADGDLTMALTLIGLALGMGAWTLVDVAAGPFGVVRAPVAWATLGALGPPTIAAIALLAALECMRLWRTRPARLGVLQLLALPRYRLSTAALMIGAIGGVLYAVKGAWSYTGYLHGVIRALPRHASAPGLLGLLLFLSLFSGMVAAAVQRGSFRWRSQPAAARWRAFGGGTLMGIGAGMIPGGNDALLLTGLPTLSAYAIGAYAALLAGVAVTLLAMQRAGRPLTCVRCEGDLYDAP